MTLSIDDIEAINSMIKTQILSTVITSPRFTDYRPQEILVEENPAGVADESSANNGEDGLGGVGTSGVGDIGTVLAASRGGNLSALAGRAASIAGVAAPIAIAFLIQPVAEQVIAELQRPGGIFDKRVRIDAQEEAFAELDRQTRQNTRIGDRQVIIQQFDGFRNFDGIASTNTSRLIRENADRVLDIGLFDRAGGVR